MSWFESDRRRFGSEIPPPKIKSTKVRDACNLHNLSPPHPPPSDICLAIHPFWNLSNRANKFVTSGGREGEDNDAARLGERYDWGGGRGISGLNVCLFLFIGNMIWRYLFLIFRFDLEEAVEISESSCNTRKDNKQTYLRSKLFLGHFWPF